MVFLIMLFKGLKELGIQPQLDGCRIPFTFKSGGDDPGLGCRATDAVVARALPEFATRKVVNSNDRYALQVSVVTYHDHAENWMSGSFPDALGHPGSCRLIHN